MVATSLQSTWFNESQDNATGCNKSEAQSQDQSKTGANDNTENVSDSDDMPDVGWDVVVSKFGTGRKDIVSIQQKFQSHLHRLSLQISECHNVDAIQHVWTKLREASAILSMQECAIKAEDPQEKIPSNKKVTTQRTKLKPSIHPTSKLCNSSKTKHPIQSRVRMTKPTPEETKDIKQSTLLCSWLTKRVKISLEERGICSHS